MGELVFILIVLAICLVVFLILRQLVLWYWRINQIIEQQEKQTELLVRIANLLETQNKQQQTSYQEMHAEKETVKEEKRQQETIQNQEPETIFKKGDAVNFCGKLLLIGTVYGDGTYGCTLPDGTHYADIEGNKLKVW